MFTRETVLDLMDAGVPEVIRLFNRTYTQIMRNGAGMRGGGALTPIFSVPRAYDLAFDQTIATLNAFATTGIAPRKRMSRAESNFIKALGL